jgi:hypothetical protein
LVSEAEWGALSTVERAFLINGMEMDLLAGVFGDLDPDERELPLPELARILLTMVDRGWLGVHRYIDWTAPDGRLGNTPGDAITRTEVPAVLADPVSWAYPDGSRWTGAVTLVRTEAGRAIGSRAPRS